MQIFIMHGSPGAPACSDSTADSPRWRCSALVVVPNLLSGTITTSSCLCLLVSRLAALMIADSRPAKRN